MVLGVLLLIVRGVGGEGVGAGVVVVVVVVTLSLPPPPPRGVSSVDSVPVATDAVGVRETDGDDDDAPTRGDEGIGGMKEAKESGVGAVPYRA